MRQHLTDSKINAIVGIIDGWTGKLTWNLLIEKIEPTTGRYSRQSLEKQPRIKSAFNIRKEHLRGRSKSSKENLSIVETKLVERLERLEAENNRLKKENNSLLEQFVRWQYNASARGITANQLNEALPSIDREASKPTRNSRPTVFRGDRRVKT
ncbi:hypothetical protein [uncultured Cohaesibacter sp.]|uniref:hypothetical protein n=1 Tax=uncultured Cohaesibacter sp. TaxID=1002546 RepID=UPI0029C610C8|nr:hypothetical protein [uncultured Cohaesibacter sp.]